MCPARVQIWLLGLLWQQPEWEAPMAHVYPARRLEPGGGVEGVWLPFCQFSVGNIGTFFVAVNFEACVRQAVIR